MQLEGRNIAGNSTLRRDFITILSPARVRQGRKDDCFEFLFRPNRVNNGNREKLR